MGWDADDGYAIVRDGKKFRVVKFAAHVKTFKTIRECNEFIDNARGIAACYSLFFHGMPALAKINQK